MFAVKVFMSLKMAIDNPVPGDRQGHRVKAIGCDSDPGSLLGLELDSVIHVQSTPSKFVSSIPIRVV